jgi:hypothetical protein
MEENLNIFRTSYLKKNHLRIHLHVKVIFEKSTRNPFPK